MELKNVTKTDGLACAHLINLLQSGRWDMSGKEREIHQAVVIWLSSLANQMAEHLRSTPAPTPPNPSAPAAGTFRVKAMGPLAAGSTKKAKKQLRK